MRFLPPLKVVLAGLMVYLGVSFALLYSISRPPAFGGIIALQQGETKLVTDPEEAATHFEEASRAFEESFNRLQRLPFMFKLATPLPPFRYQVELLKANYDLALAGKDAAILSSKLPSLTTSNGDLDQKLQFLSSKAFGWQRTNQEQIDSLNLHLSSARIRLEKLPTWPFLDQHTQVRYLRDHVQQSSRVVSGANIFSLKLHQGLGSNDDAVHRFALVIHDDQQVLSWSIIEAKQGKINSNVSQSTAPSWNSDLHEMLTPLEQASNLPIEGVISFDAESISTLLSVLGPVILPNATIIQEGSRSETMKNPQAATSLIAASFDKADFKFWQVVMDQYAKGAIQVEIPTIDKQVVGAMPATDYP